MLNNPIFWFLLFYLSAIYASHIMPKISSVKNFMTDYEKDPDTVNCPASAYVIISSAFLFMLISFSLTGATFFALAFGDKIF